MSRRDDLGARGHFRLGREACVGAAWRSRRIGSRAVVSRGRTIGDGTIGDAAVGYRTIVGTTETRAAECANTTRADDNSEERPLESPGRHDLQRTSLAAFCEAPPALSTPSAQR